MAIEEKDRRVDLETFLQTLLQEKSAKMYLRSWDHFCITEGIGEKEIPIEAQYSKYFKYLCLDKKFKQSSLHSILSRLRTCHEYLFKSKLEVFNKLQTYLKNLHQPKEKEKTKRFSREELKQFIMNQKWNNRYWLVRKAVMTFAFFGSHRISDLRKLKMENLKFRSNAIHVTFERATKIRDQTKTLKYVIPKRDYRISDPLESTCWSSLIESYLKAVHDDINVTSGCMFYTARDCKNSGKFSTVPMGRNNFAKLGKDVAEALGKSNPEEYIGNCWRGVVTPNLESCPEDPLALSSREDQDGRTISLGDPLGTPESQDLSNKSPSTPMETESIDIKEEMLSCDDDLTSSESSITKPKLRVVKVLLEQKNDDVVRERDAKLNGTSLPVDQLTFEDHVDKFSSIVKFMASKLNSDQAKEGLLNKLNSVPLGLIKINEDPMRVPRSPRKSLE